MEKVTFKLPPAKVRKARGKGGQVHRDRTKYTRKGRSAWRG